MANPNIVSVTSIYGKTTYLTPAGTSAVVLLQNASSSGTVMKINQSRPLKTRSRSMEVY